MNASNINIIEQLIEKGNQLSRVLRVTTVCTCRYNIPYEDSHMKRICTQRCQRCVVLEEWEKLF